MAGVLYTMVSCTQIFHVCLLLSPTRIPLPTSHSLGLCSQRKQKEVSDILGMDIGQESWENVESAVVVSGYKWFGKPRKILKNARGEGGVGFLVCECLVEVEFISKVCYEESLWMKV